MWKIYNALPTFSRFTFQFLSQSLTKFSQSIVVILMDKNTIQKGKNITGDNWTEVNIFKVIFK